MTEIETKEAFDEVLQVDAVVAFDTWHKSQLEEEVREGARERERQRGSASEREKARAKESASEREKQRVRFE